MPPDVSKLRGQVREKLALDTSWRDDGWLSELLEELVVELDCKTVSRLLETLEEKALSHPAWVALIDRLTIAETYFFRDRGQMELLRDTILPELIREAQGRRLRIWSAGCSTGEELYSIAMLVDALGAPAVELLGTDVNAYVIEQASRGLYRERSLRGLPDALRKAYLKPHGRELRISSRLQEKTRFWVENLLLGEGEPQMRGIDLIICRNVFIYFEKTLIPEVLERFYRALRPNGLLMTGHGELIGLELPFETKIYPQSLVHRRPDLPRSQSVETHRARPLPLHRLPAPPPRAKEEIRDARAFHREARAARRGGESEKARRLLRKALYLDPEAVEAYLELALLSLPDADKARKHRSTALEILTKTPLTAERRSSEIRKALEELERELR